MLTKNKHFVFTILMVVTTRLNLKKSNHYFIQQPAVHQYNQTREQLLHHAARFQTSILVSTIFSGVLLLKLQLFVLAVLQLMSTSCQMGGQLVQTFPPAAIGLQVITM